MAVRATAPLRPGDAMAVVAASSALADAERLHQGVSLLESWGCAAVLTPLSDATGVT